MFQLRRRLSTQVAGSAFVLATLALCLAACSTSDLGLSGLTGLGSASLSQSGTPTIQGRDPGGTYAFIYGNQVWLKKTSDPTPHQLTHLALPAGATYSWGPIVWATDGAHLAVALGQSQDSSNPAVVGGLYIIDISSGDALLTSGTSSVYGHAYTWYGASALFYSNGSGIQFYDFSDPADPRPYPAVVGSNGPAYGGTQFVTFGDIQFVGQWMYATQINVATLGADGTVGTAGVYRYYLPVSPDAYAGGTMGISRAGLSGNQVVDLGQAFTDGHGNVVAGAWSITTDSGFVRGVVYDRITGVDTKANTVKSTICYGSSFGYCYPTLFGPVSTYPRTARPQFAFSSDGQTIAFGGPAVSTEGNDGSGFAKLTPGAMGLPPQWSPTGSAFAATQQVIVPASGTTPAQTSTNVVMYAGGKSSILISGAQSLSWSP
jgi:hypothetical protein